MVGGEGGAEQGGGGSLREGRRREGAQIVRGQWWVAREGRGRAQLGRWW